MEGARKHFEAALAINRQVGSRRLEGIVLGNLGVTHIQQGAMEQARACYENALAIHREIGDARFEGVALGNLGDWYREQGRLDEARTRFEPALAIHRRLGNSRYESSVLSSLGLLSKAQGLTAEALTYFDDAIRVARQAGDRHAEGAALGGVADILAGEGRIDDAKEALAAGEDLLRLVRGVVELAGLLCTRGELAYREGDLTLAGLALSEATSLADLIGARPDSAVARNIAKLRRLLS
jgi:tetratricopeptide (TPR) repeat protein